MSSTPETPGETASHPHPTHESDEARQADPSAQKVGSKDEASAQRSADPNPSTQQIGSSDGASAQRLTDSDPFNDDVKKLHSLLRSGEVHILGGGGSSKDLKKHENVVRILKGLKKAQIDAPDPAFKGETALHIAAQRGLLEVAKALIQSEAFVSVEDNEQNQPLHWASKGRYADFAELLLEEGADILAVNNKGRSPLHLSSQEGHVDVVRLLLENEAYVLAIDHLRRSPLYLASQEGKTEVVKCLLGKDKTNIDAESAGGGTPLHRACLFAHVETVRALLEGGASPLVQIGIGYTPLSIATHLRHQKILDALLEFKDDENHRKQLEIPDLIGQTPLMIAIKDQFFEGVKKLLDAGANCNATSDEGGSCLRWALWRFSTEIFDKMMKQRDLNVDATDKEGRTALHYICGAPYEYGKPFTIEQEVEMAENDEEKTEARPPTDYGVFEQLLEKSPDLSLRTLKGETVLRLIVQHEKTALIPKLFDYVDPELVGEEVMPTEDGNGAMHLEETQDKIVTDLCKHEAIFHKVMFWSAADKARHSLAKMLLSRDQPEGEGEGGIKRSSSAIEWAIHRSLPKILWWLIATSPPGFQTQKYIKAAEARLDKLLTAGNEANRHASSSTSNSGESLPIGPLTLKAAAEAEESAQKYTILTGFTDRDGNKGTINDQESMRNILKDLPVGLVYRESGRMRGPKRKAESSSVLSKFNSCVMRFYRGDSVSGTIRRNPTVDEVIYTIGPTMVMKDAANKLKRVLEIGSTGGKHDIATEEIRGLYDKEKLRFTWIHLPVTNIDWMQDLVQTILAEESRRTDVYRQVSSFLRDTWFEIPDRTSASRIMRPQFMIREPNGSTATTTQQSPGRSTGQEEGSQACQGKHNEGSQQGMEHEGDHNIEEKDTPEKPGKEKDGKSKKSDFMAASALYMPFLSPSTFCPHEFGTESGEAHPQEGISQFKVPWERLEGLKRAYRQSIIHESATLDESYYHFAADKGAQDDRFNRNTAQVVSKAWKHRKRLDAMDANEAGGDELGFEPILRVNQIWIWTIADKWLISATSPAVNEKESNWVDDFIDHMGKRADDTEVQSQPQSTDEMMKMIVDFCIESYERPPVKAEVTFEEEGAPNLGTTERTPESTSTAPAGDAAETQQTTTGQKDRHESNSLNELSIRQIFSNYINAIGRRETALFNNFRKEAGVVDSKSKSSQTENGKIQTVENDTVDRKAVEVDAQGLEKAGKVQKALQEEVKVFSEIRDIRDELAMVKSIAKYQRIVQDSLYKNSKDKELSTRYIVDDLEEMDKLAERIESAVKATITLQESEIANRQAAQAVKQGQTVLLFTVVTILFVPMSFLSSLFALDANSALQTPPWIYVVIFVSLAFTGPLGYIFMKPELRRFFGFMKQKRNMLHGHMKQERDKFYEHTGTELRKFFPGANQPGPNDQERAVSETGQAEAKSSGYLNMACGGFRRRPNKTDLEAANTTQQGPDGATTQEASTATQPSPGPSASVNGKK